MAIAINSASQITLTGGTAGTPLLMTHLTTLANWPAGTTQATVDSYITRTTNSYTFNIKAGKVIMCQGYLDQSDATIKHEGTNSYIIADNGGVITGGKYVSGKVFGRTTWLFDIGAQSTPQPASTNESFLRGSGQINMVGLRVQNNSQQPCAAAGHTGIVFWAGSTGSYNLQDLEILSEGNSPVYVTFNTDNTTAGSSSVSIREARVGAIRHSTQNVTLSFINGGGGWIGGDNGTTKNKLLIPTTQTTYVGLAPVFQNAGDIININNKDFNSPSFVAEDAQLEKSRITMYPNATTNRAEIKKTFNFKFQNLTGSQVNNTKVRATSQRIVTTGGVPATAVTTEILNNEFNYDGNTKVTVWLGTGARTGTGDGVYLLPNIVTDDTNISLLFRHLAYFEQTASTNSELGSVTFTNALVTDTYYTSETAVPAEVVFTKATKTIDLTALVSTITVDQLHDYSKIFLKANMEVTNFLQPTGKIENITDWKILGIEKLVAGTKLDTIQSTATHTAGGAFSIVVLGKVKQDTPTNLPATADFTELEYNTNTPVSVVYAGTSRPTGKVTNIGTATVTIQGGALTDYTDAEINYLNSTATVHLPTGFDEFAIYASNADALNEVNALFSGTAVSNVIKYKAELYGGQTIYIRPKDNDIVGEVLIMPQVIPVGIGNYDFTVVSFWESTQLNTLIAQVTNLTNITAIETTAQSIKWNTDLIPATI